MTSKRQNKFADLISAAREPQEETPPEPPAEPPAETSRQGGSFAGRPGSGELAGPATQGTSDPAAQQGTSAPPEPPRRGRPPTGKRSNPAYEQVTAYIRKDTSLKTKIALLQEGNTRDFSDLVEELLQAWLRDRLS